MTPRMPAFIAVLLTGYGARLQADVCADIRLLQLPNAMVTEAQRVPAGDFVAPDGARYRVNAFCRVQAVARPTSQSEIRFEVWLPENAWNGRYYQHGEGGGGGAINYHALAAFINDGAAGGATDNGHRKDARLSYDWAYGQPEKIVDFGYRALQVTRDHAQQLIAKRYGKPPRRYYFAGCSGGGAEAMMAAQRFPERWDGILAGAPDQDAIGFFASTAWQAHRWLTAPDGRIPPDKLPLIEKAALASCSADAHVDRGIAADPRFCRFDPGVLTCKGVSDTACLTLAQVETVRRVYAGPRDGRTGQPIYHGFPPTVEVGWSSMITGGHKLPFGYSYAPDEPAAMHFAMKFFRAFVFNDPSWDLRALDLERDVAHALRKSVSGVTLAHAQNANDADLARLRVHGAKLILYVGWGDAAISPLNIITYYQSVGRAMGATERDEFSRLFVVPGLDHCSGGRGASAFGQIPGISTSSALKDDAEHHVLRALEAWVEEGKAPDRLIAARYIDSLPEHGVAYTRPLCPYPQLPVYQGEGSRDSAANFRCVANPSPR